MLDFKDTLIRLRKQNGITQDELSKALNVSRSTIGNYEQGTREPNFEMLEKIADYFNISMADLLNDDSAARLLMYHEKFKKLLEYADQLDHDDLIRLEERARIMAEDKK